MPIACPACGRPNSDRASQCVYCTESLEGLAVEQAIADTPASATSSSRHLIIILPQPDKAGDSGETASRFAEIVGMNLYDARLALQTERPRLLRKMKGASEAQETSNRLVEAGIAHFTIDQADVESIEIVPVRHLFLREQGLELGFAGGQELISSYQDLLLLVRGEIVRETHSERRMATVQGATRPLTPGLRLHIYAKNTAAAAAEVDPEQFDWSVLGDSRSPSTLLNFQRLVDEILLRAPTAVLDRGFDWEPVVLSRAQDGSEIGSRLAVEQGGQEAATYDNETQFRFYSRWRYLIARAAGRG